MGKQDRILRVDSQYYPTYTEMATNGQYPGPYYSTAYFYLYTPVTSALNIASGNQQAVLEGQLAAQPLTVQALCSTGLGVSGTPVTFSVVSGTGGSLSTDGGASWFSSRSVSTDNNGYGSVLFQAGQSAGTVTVVANSASIGSVSFTEVVGASTDTDGDGMPDWWEIANGLSYTDPTDALKDADGDRVPNLWEFYGGTNPQDATSYPLPDVIVDGSQPSDPSQQTYATLQEAYNALPLYDLNGVTPYHGIIQVMQGTYTSGVDGSAAPRNVLWLGDSTGPTVVQCSGTAMVVSGDTVIDGFIFQGSPQNTGSAVVAQPPSGATQPPRVRLANCIIDSRQGGLAAVVNEGAELWVVQCTLVGCQGSAANAILNASGTLHLVNSVVGLQSSGSSVASVVDSSGVSGAVTVQNSVITGMDRAWESVDANPMLTTAGGHLTASSTACVGHGTTAAVAGVQVDIHGQPRPASSPSDLGAEQWVDEDGNGLPDWWELAYFGATGQDPTVQTNGNGLTNLQEFMQGLNPNDWFNGQTPVLSITGGNNQSMYLGEITGTPPLSPLTVSLQTSGVGGTAWTGAPVTFSRVVRKGAGDVSCGDGPHTGGQCKS